MTGNHDPEVPSDVKPEPSSSDVSPRSELAPPRKRTRASRRSAEDHDDDDDGGDFVPASEDDEPVADAPPAPRPAKRGRPSKKSTGTVSATPPAAPFAEGPIDAPVPAMFTTAQSPEYLAARLRAERAASGWWVPFDADQCLDSHGEDLTETPDVPASEADVAAWIDDPNTKFGQPDLFLGSDTVTFAHRVPMPEDCLDESHVWLDPNCPVLAELSFHQEPVFRLERVHFEGANPNLLVDHDAVEYIHYRLANRDRSQKLSHVNFMGAIDSDPWFTRRHRKAWGILKKSGRVLEMNLFSIAGAPAFAVPDRGPTDDEQTFFIPAGSFNYLAPWARTDGVLLMPAGRALPSRLFIDLDPNMMPYVRLVLRPVYRERYTNAGNHFTYQLGLYLRTDKANRDLCDPARRSATRGILRKLFRLYHPAMTKESKAESLRLPPITATSSPSLSEWLAELETSKAARTLTFMPSRAHTEPYFRLGPGGMVFNYLTGEFAPTCPASWLLPLPQPQHLEIRAAIVHGSSDAPDLCSSLLVSSLEDVPAVQREVGEDAAALFLVD
ncbi:hypothetical protein H9P43_008300 [Blastocladiella emersonii ATCC 22665]|nr:hypothetical protein H9P43_008300 [Blastocladiella emersonii ATCC 22665]